MPTPEALASQTIDALCRGEASALYRLDTTSIPLADASPLQESALYRLDTTSTPLVDASPLQQSALYRLDTTSIPLADASPLLDTHAGRTGRWIANTLKGTSDE